MLLSLEHPLALFGSNHEIQGIAATYGHVLEDPAVDRPLLFEVEVHKLVAEDKLRIVPCGCNGNPERNTTIPQIFESFENSFVNTFPSSGIGLFF